MTACGVAAWALQTVGRGSFDMSSVDNATSFIRFTLTLGIAVGLCGPALHWALRRSLSRLLWDASVLSLVGTVLSLAHPSVLGWHLGFPIPAPPLFFFPFFAALFLASANGVGLLLGACAWMKSPRY